MRTGFLLLGLLFISACKPDLIPNTSITDTKRNRAVIDFMQEYKKAVESHSVDQIMALVSPVYADRILADAPPEVLNPEQLRAKLTDALTHIKQVALSIHVQDVHEEDKLITVTYYYIEHALVSTPTGEQWNTFSDVNRMYLTKKPSKEGGGFEIISGL